MQRDRSSGQQESKGAERELSVHDYLTTILKTFLEDVEKASEDELRLDVSVFSLAIDEDMLGRTFRRRSVEDVSFSARLLAIMHMITMKERAALHIDEFSAEVLAPAVLGLLNEIEITEESMPKLKKNMEIILDNAGSSPMLQHNVMTILALLEIKKKTSNQSKVTESESKIENQLAIDKFKKQIAVQSESKKEVEFFKITFPGGDKVKFTPAMLEKLQPFLQRAISLTKADLEREILKLTAYQYGKDDILLEGVNASSDEKELITCYCKIQRYLKEENVAGYVLAVTQLGEQLEKIEKPILSFSELSKKYHLSKFDDHKGYFEATGGAFLLDKPSFFAGWGFLESKVSKKVEFKEQQSVTMHANSFAYELKSIAQERKAFDEALEDLNQHGLKLKEPGARAVVATLVCDLKLARDELLIKGESGVQEFEKKAKELFKNAYPTMQQPRTWSGDRQSQGIARILTHVSAVISYYARKLIGSSLKSTHDADRPGWQFYKTKTSEKALSLEEKVDKLTSKIKKPGSR